MQVIINFINNALKFTHEGQVLLDYHLRKTIIKSNFRLQIRV